MRCSPKLCIGLLIIGIGGAALLAYTGNVKAGYALSILPLLACPLICLVMMMFGLKCDEESCDRKSSSNTHTHE